MDCKSTVSVQSFLRNTSTLSVLLSSYIVEAASIEALERRIDRYWRHQDIVCNYEMVLSLGYSDRAGNDISPDSSENDLDRSNDLRPVKT